MASGWHPDLWRSGDRFALRPMNLRKRPFRSLCLFVFLAGAMGAMGAMKGRRAAMTCPCSLVQVHVCLWLLKVISAIVRVEVLNNMSNLRLRNLRLTVIVSQLSPEIRTLFDLIYLRLD